MSLGWVWSVGSKPVGRKCRNDKAKIFRLKAENRKAKNTIRPKLMYMAYWRFIMLLFWQFIWANIPSYNKLSKQGLWKKNWPYRRFGLLVIFRLYGKNIISAYLFWSYGPARTSPHARLREWEWKIAMVPYLQLSTNCGFDNFITDKYFWFAPKACSTVGWQLYLRYLSLPVCKEFPVVRCVDFWPLQPCMLTHVRFR